MHIHRARSRTQTSRGVVFRPPCISVKQTNKQTEKKTALIRIFLHFSTYSTGRGHDFGCERHRK